MAAIEITPRDPPPGLDHLRRRRRRDRRPVGAVAVDAPHKISHGFEKFTESKPPSDPEELQDRLTDLNNNGRLRSGNWRWNLRQPSARTAPGRAPSPASGRRKATTIQGRSTLTRSTSEMLAELGLPGLLFLLVAMLAIFVGLGVRIRGPDRVLYAALFAASLAWAVARGRRLGLGDARHRLLLLRPGRDGDRRRPGRGGGLGAARRRAVRRASRSASAAWSLVVTPALVAISQGKLDSAVKKLQEGNCGGASKEALDAIHVLSVRPDPYQVIGFCDMREGQDALAVSMLETAVDRDEGEWESWYGLAVVQAAAGQDPRAAARRGLRTGPARTAGRKRATTVHDGNPRKWKRRAAKRPPSNPLAGRRRALALGDSVLLARFERIIATPTTIRTPMINSGIATKPVNGRLLPLLTTACCSAGDRGDFDFGGRRGSSVRCIACRWRRSCHRWNRCRSRSIRCRPWSRHP